VTRRTNEHEDLQSRLGVYTAHDVAVLSNALHGFPLSELGPACRDRVDALRALTETGLTHADAATDVQTDRASFLVLAYACCVNHGKWFVQNEARRLMSKVASLTVSDKAAVLGLLHVEVQPMQAALQELELLALAFKKRKLVGEETVRANWLQCLVKGFAHAVAVPLAEITSEKWHAFFAVDFEDATCLVAARQAVLHSGTAYVQDWQLTVLIRRTCEARLVAFIQQCKQRLDKIGTSNTAYNAPQFLTVLSIMHDVQFRVCPVAPQEFDGLGCTAQTLPIAVAQFAPLCIVKLVLKLQATRHLIDKERVTLRLWLCAVKVSLDVAVDFWQSRVSEEEKVRAPLALAYGKRYACVGCPKIRGLRLCPFQDTEKSIVSWCADTMPSAVRDIEDIVRKTKCPSERCGKVFALRYAPRACKYPSNPANYFARAAEAGLQ
jgi:DNA primase large subunit